MGARRRRCAARRGCGAAWNCAEGARESRGRGFPAVRRQPGRIERARAGRSLSAAALARTDVDAATLAGSALALRSRSADAFYRRRRHRRRGGAVRRRQGPDVVAHRRESRKTGFAFVRAAVLGAECGYGGAAEPRGRAIGLEPGGSTQGPPGVKLTRAVEGATAAQALANPVAQAPASPAAQPQASPVAQPAAGPAKSF